MNDIELLALEWLKYRLKNEVEGIEILPQLTSAGMVVWFYYEETLKDLPFFLTVPMCEELLSGKNPKRVKNNFSLR